MRNGLPVAAFDNDSVWDTELRPGSITKQLQAAPVREFRSVQECFDAEVHVRLQNGREIWLRGKGPGQMRMGRIQRIAFWLRNKIEAKAFPME
jgi:hypothetical protein